MTPDPTRNDTSLRPITGPYHRETPVNSIASGLGSNRTLTTSLVTAWTGIVLWCRPVRLPEPTRPFGPGPEVNIVPAWLRASLAWTVLSTLAVAQDLRSVSEGVAAAERLGAALARIGDVDQDGFDDLAVGAPEAGSSGGGVALVSSATGARILAVAGATPLGRFGASIVTLDDLTSDGRPDLAVGAPGSGGSNPGTVHLLDGATLASFGTIPGPAAGVRFGERLVRLDDQTGDGVAEIAAAAPGANGGAGAVLVLDVTTGGVLRTVPGLFGFDAFGTGLGTVPDLSGDARRDLVIGAPGYDPTGLVGAGRVDVVDPVTGVVVKTLLGSASGDALGFACDGTLDVDGDGTPDVVAGAPGATAGGMPNAGSCFVFNGVTGAVISKVDGLAMNDAIGSTVVGLGDLEGDGRGDYACGSPTARVLGLVDAGRLLVVSGGFGLAYEFTGAAAGDGVGAVCVGVGDLDGDARDDLVLGAPEHPGAAGAAAGRVEVRRGLAAAFTLESNGQYGSPFSLRIQGTPTATAFLLIDVLPGSVPSPYGTICLGFTPLLLLRTVGPLSSGGFHEASGTLPPVGPLNATIHAQAVLSNPFPGPLYWAGGCVSLTLF